MNESFEELLNGYLNDKLTQEELSRFLQLLDRQEHAGSSKEAISQLLINYHSSNLADKNKADAIFKKILNSAMEGKKIRKDKVFPLKQQSKFFSITKIVAAASVIGLLITCIYIGYKKNIAKEAVKIEKNSRFFKNDILPGGDRAVLTLNDGSVVVLDTAQNGALAQQGNTNVLKLNGKLFYHSANTGSNEILYNTISTPRGGQYQIELPDGSQVWLNAASSLHFPTAFAGKERRVEITGEAYFEVAKNAASPFIVSVSGAEVQVLGTHFNVMAYDDEAVLKTTLLEGAVRFEKGDYNRILRPGEQSQLKANGQLNVVTGVDVSEVVAWKNGTFNFNGADLETIMRNLSHWYDVEVVYNKKVKDLFYLEMPRSSKLSDILRVLELTGNIKFEIEGKKIIVLQ